MERGMFGILVLLGLFHCVFSYLHSRYNFINTPKTWSEARKYCREKYVDLATITEERDLVELAALTEPDVQLVFIGLHRAWGWSYPGAEVYSQRELAYLNWASGEPKQNFHYCAGMGKDGTWVSANCSTRMNFFCYEESETRITERFILKRESLSWADARQSCRKHHTDLAKVRDMIDNNILHMMVGGGPVWFGLTDAFWVWSDGSERSIIPWKPNEPHSNGFYDCAELEFNSKTLAIVDENCAVARPFFCYGDLIKKHMVRVALTATASDMTHTAVMESTLKWVEKELSDGLARQYVKLSWIKPPEKGKNTTQEKTFKTGCTS